MSETRGQHHRGLEQGGNSHDNDLRSVDLFDEPLVTRFPQMNSNDGRTIQNHGSEALRATAHDLIFLPTTQHAPQLARRHHWPNVLLHILPQTLAAGKLTGPRLEARTRRSIKARRMASVLVSFAKRETSVASRSTS